jgi:hypothetical protein
MGTAMDVAIGVVFVYLLLALIVTTVIELIASCSACAPSTFTQRSR